MSLLKVFGCSSSFFSSAAKTAATMKTAATATSFILNLEASLRVWKRKKKYFKQCTVDPPIMTGCVRPSCRDFIGEYRAGPPGYPHRPPRVSPLERPISKETSTCFQVLWSTKESLEDIQLTYKLFLSLIFLIWAFNYKSSSKLILGRNFVF